MTHYNREEFIENYELTKEEYLVLSFEERMEYAHQLFGYKVDDLKQVGDTIVFGHIIDSCFYEYFETCGCRVNEEDLGVEITEIVKIGENKYEHQECASEKLTNHTKLVGSTKSEIIDEKICNFYQVKIDNGAKRYLLHK